MRLSGSDGQENIIWVACISYASRMTTNILAEFRGLCVGLVEGHWHNLLDIHVVGYSQLILAFLNLNRLQRNRSLLPLYPNARMLADKLAGGSWTYHYWCNKKTADFWLLRQ